MAFFRSLQDSAFTDWFLGSESLWAYPTVLTLHTIGLAMLVGASLIIHLRMLGVSAAFPIERLATLYRIIWAGFVVNLASGLVLFVTSAADRATDPVFGVKLASIALGLWLGARVKTRVIDDRANASAASVQGARWWSIGALACWTVAIVGGRLMAYLTH